MTYLVQETCTVSGTRTRDTAPRSPRAPLLLVVEDGTRLSDALAGLCDFLRISVEAVGAEDDLAQELRRRRPMAVLTEMDGAVQDGCYVMMRIAEYDRALPVMLLTGTSPPLIGAAEAVQELCQLTEVSRCAVLPEIGEIVEFLFQAGRSGSCLGLVPI